MRAAQLCRLTANLTNCKVRHFAKKGGIPGINVELDDLLLDSRGDVGDMDFTSKSNSPGQYAQPKGASGVEVAPGEMLNSHYLRQAGIRSLVGEAFASEAVRWTGKESNGFKAYNLFKKIGAFKERNVEFQFRSLGLSKEEIQAIQTKLKSDAQEKLEACMKKDKLHIFMSGAAGFIGQEFCQTVASSPDVRSVHCVILEEETKGMPLKEWTSLYLNRLDIPVEFHSKFHFIFGDCEKPKFGLSEVVLTKLKTSITHLAHLAASVSFEDPYEFMYKKNVLATQHALEIATLFQTAPDSPFVNAIMTETCYIHGRFKPEMAREGSVPVEFPSDYYNNHYELTKALSDVLSMEACYKNGLRVIACCPAIVIGHSVHGNNHGDRKVINAAVNAFGRIFEELSKLPQPIRAIALRSVMAFPGTASVVMNISPVDRVTSGLVAALQKPGATGERIHLGCGGINTGHMSNLFYKEIGIWVAYVNPVVHRYIRKPFLKLLFMAIGQPQLFPRLELLFNIFGGYSEWGQPNHELGNDVRLLGLSPQRPDLSKVMLILARHNKQVQGWGQVRDRDEIARREKLWKDFIMEINSSGKECTDLDRAEFQKRVASAKLW